jgi:hypothetical protein
MTIRLESTLDKIVETAASMRNVAAFYWAKAQGVLSTKIGKAALALLVLAVIAAYAHHRGTVSASAKLTVQVEQLKRQLAQVPAPAPAPECASSPNFEQEHGDADLASRLAESEEAKKTLEKKVADYEKQLAQSPAKAGRHILSPADARRLSNIK